MSRHLTKTADFLVPPAASIHPKLVMSDDLKRKHAELWTLIAKHLPDKVSTNP